MKFKEFEKQCQENYSSPDNTCIYDALFIDGLQIEVYKLDDGSFSIDTSSDFFRQGEQIYEHQVVIGNYATLRQAYNALVKICLMNNVKMKMNNEIRNRRRS